MSNQEATGDIHPVKVSDDGFSFEEMPNLERVSFEWYGDFANKSPEYPPTSSLRSFPENAEYIPHDDVEMETMQLLTKAQVLGITAIIIGIISIVLAGIAILVRIL